ncbi:MAG: aspartyl protease family protein [Pseudomonadota bacterium]
MKRLLPLIALVLISACTTPLLSPGERLSSLPTAYVTPSPPIDPEVSPFLVNVMLNGQGPFTMLVDTGSSRSAIFQSATNRLGLTPDISSTIRVRGLSSVVPRPVVRDVDLELGPFTFEGLDMVDLPDRDEPRFQGIIGVDVLSSFVMVFDAEQWAMVFVPREDMPTNTFDQWVEVETVLPPSGIDDFGLGFINAYVGFRQVTALIDTGSSLSVANWETALYSPRVRLLRRQLRRQWELEGANGSFQPHAFVRLPNLRMRSFEWSEPAFLLSDLDTLDVLGADTDPFIIVGFDLLEQQSFAFDVVGKRVWFEPSGSVLTQTGVGTTTINVDR